MKKCLLVLLLAGLCSCSPSTRRAATSHDWSEPADPAGESPAAAWSAVEGFNVSFGSIDARYPRSQPFAGEIVREHNLVGWKGEKLSAQAVVWTSAEVKDLECKVGDFVSADGAKLKDIARARFVKYVLSDQFNRKKPCGPRQPGEPSHLSADMLDEITTLTVPAKTARPVWITVEVPRDAKAGRYRADVEIKGAGVKPRTLTLNLEVTGRTLPKPSEWAYHLDLWQHPAAVARVQGVKVWSDEHFRLMKPLMRMLADAGQKVITTNVNKEPWNNQCYDAYADMIIWTKHPDGTWEYDFKAFDRWVEFMMGLGVNKMINCYSMLPWNNMLHYKDAATGKFVDVKADPGTPEFREMWAPFLPAFQKHLREKGWLKITNIAMDERSAEHMAAATSLLAEVAPELGIALADNKKIFKKYPHIKDMCASIFGPIDHADILARRAKGLTTTFYVCCSSEFPNTYTFSDPAEAVYLSWHAAAHDYDGMLRWTYNSWTADPIRDSRFRTWAAGDTYIVYPECRSSIRFERLVEGIQDWEKIRLLKRELSAGDAASREKLEAFESLLSAFRKSTRTDGWNDRLNEAKQLLNTL